MHRMAETRDDNSGAPPSTPIDHNLSFARRRYCDLHVAESVSIFFPSLALLFSSPSHANLPCTVWCCDCQA